MINIYPFTITCHGESGHGYIETFNRLWFKFFGENRECINETYGDSSWGGGTKKISWYEVDLEIMSPTQGIFKVYGIKNSTYGGRGELEYEIPVLFRNDELKPHILREQREIATYEYEERVVRLKKRIRDTRIETIRKELFTS